MSSTSRASDPAPTRSSGSNATASGRRKGWAAIAKDCSKLSDDALLAWFAEIGVAQYRAQDDLNYRRYNALFDLLDAVDRELRARGPASHAKLAQLYDHENARVRLEAAYRTLDINPASARVVIEDLARLHPTGLGNMTTGAAASLLERIKDGTHVQAIPR